MRRVMLLEKVRELSGLRWELWDAGDRSRRAHSALGRARAERLLLERRLGVRDAGTPVPVMPAVEREAPGATAADASAVVLLCPDLGRAMGPALEALRRAGIHGISVAAARNGLHTEQRLLRIEREGVRVHRSATSLGQAANDAIRGGTSSHALVLRATERLTPKSLECCRGLVLGEQPFALLALTGEAGCGGASADLLLAGLTPAATLVSRALFDSIGGFDETLEDGLDLELWLRASAQGARVAVVDGALAAPEPGASFFAGQAWGEELLRIVSRHAAALSGEETLAALGRAAADLMGRVEDARRLAAAAEEELLREREALPRLGNRLREAGRPRFDLGDLPRDGLVSEEWGADRGKPIDRWYIEAFLRRHEDDVRGRCLEIKEPAYTKWFGGKRVTASDVLDIDRSNPEATLHGDLSLGADIPDAQYDCFVLTQTLHLLYDFKGALFHAVRVLRPSGTLLVTVPAVARVLPGDAGIDTDYWRFTEASMRRLFAELLPLDAFSVSVYGNAASAAAFLHGLAAEDLEPGELERVDAHFPVIVAVRARKPA